MFEGIYTPVITPYAPDGQIDRSVFAEVLESLIEAGVHGIVIAGSTGEYYAQTAQERREVAACATDVVGGRLPVIVGTGATRTEDSVEYARAAKEIGADGILITSPPYAMPTERENARHALAIDRAADLPIMLYNFPARMGVHMGEEYLARVGRSKNFVAIKEASGDMNQLHLLARDFPHIALSCGWDDLALEFFAWGARSWVCAASNFLPREHVALYEACVLDKDFDKGRQIMSAMLPLFNFLDEGKFVQIIKYGCELNGLEVGHARAPMRPLDADDQATVRQIAATLQQTVANITSGAHRV